VDLDDGSTNYVITNNLFLAGGLKWREGYQRTAENNMFAEGAKMSVHVWPRNNRDVFTHNIFAGYDVVNPNGWGKTIDYNLFNNGSALSAARGYGIDSHSTSGSAGYVDAAHGNFQLGASSAATALGIMSIPVDAYGVTSLSLRAQARTPFFGSNTNTDAGTRDPTPQSFPAQSQASTDGLQTLDVVLQLGDQSVVSLDDLNRLYGATSAGQKVTLGIHRLQQDTTVTITR
jgi:hypothetical protein